MARADHSRTGCMILRDFSATSGLDPLRGGDCSISLRQSAFSTFIPQRRVRAFVRDESGAMTLFLLLLIPALLLIGAFATDISQLNAQKLYIQGQSDLAAASAARHLDDLDNARSIARNVVLANDQYGSVVLTDSDIVFGHFSRDNGFVPSPDQSSPAGVDAVRVEVTAPWKTLLFSPIIPRDSRLITRSAIANAQHSVATFTLRNALLNVNTYNSPLVDPLLNGLLGASNLGLNLSAVDYSALAGTNVNLNELLGIGLSLTASTYEELLNLDIPLGDLANGLVNVGALPLGAVQGASILGDTVSVGQLVSMSPRLELLTIGDSLSEVTVNALDLLVVAATLPFAVGSDHLDLNTGLNLSPLANVQVAASLMQKPLTFVVSPDDNPVLDAEVTQIGVDLSASVAGLLKVAASVSAADATAVMTSMNCAAKEPDDIVATFDVTTDASTLALSVSLLSPIEGNDRVQTAAPTVIAGHTQTIEVRLDQIGQPIPIPGSITLSSLTSSVSSLLNGLETDLTAERAAKQAEKQALEKQRYDRCMKILFGIGCILDALISVLDGLILAVGQVISLLTSTLDALTGLLAQALFLDNLADSLLKLLGVDVARAELILDSYSCAAPGGVALVQ